MTSESLVMGRRNTVLATVIGTVLATYAGSASALEFEFENGARLNWNTTISVGASWRADEQSRILYTRADGSLLGRDSGPLPAGTAPTNRDGLAGNQAASSANLNYDQYEMFSAPLKLISDVELKKGNFGGLVRIKAWYDYALENNEVNVGNQANNYNGARVQDPALFVRAPAGADGDRTCGPRRNSATPGSRTSRSSPTSTCSTPTSTVPSTSRTRACSCASATRS